MTTTLASPRTAGADLANRHSLRRLRHGPCLFGLLRRGTAAALIVALGITAGGCVTTGEESASGGGGRDLLPVRCLEEPEAGAEQGRRVGYYYDYRTNRCKPFRYAGPNARVPFEAEAECNRVCGAER